MVKQRMSSADVAGEVACLKQRLLGLRVANIYDINAKTYILKLARSGEDGEKVLLLLESGSRFHTTQMVRDKSDTPSNFTLKLRKHIRTRRLEDVRQLGVDRIVDFVFGSGEATYHLILEMYSQGNIILTDSKYEVLTLLRSHRDDEKGLAIMARHAYPMQAVRLRQLLTLQQLHEAFSTTTQDPKATTKSVLGELLPFGPSIAEHCIVAAGLEPNQQLATAPLSPDSIQALHKSLVQLEAWFASLDSQAPPGFIMLQRAGGKKRQQQLQQQEEQNEEAMLFSECNPLVLAQLAAQPFKEFPTFDAALDEFFSKSEGQRAIVQRQEAERAAMSKLDKFKSDQQQRVASLQAEACQAELRASLIEYNLEQVDAAITAVNEALATGMDWQDLERMIKEERRAGNPVAGLIHSLQLEQNKATLLLSNMLDGEDEGDEEANTRAATKVQVDLGLSAHANAAAHFSSKKKHLDKQSKTLAANQQALKAAERKAQQQLSQVRTVSAVQHLRKPHWFERFHWFITSENYLCISGRDAQQNELIVKRYMGKGDIYVHAELHGASSTIIKNSDPDKPVPPLTLQQAGAACVCRSKAWDSKIVTSAWWVYPHQVSKTAPSGEYLPTGSFMIRGKKNFLPPQPLIFGFGFMFKLEESSIAAHIGERAVKSAADDVASMMEAADVADQDLGDLDVDDRSGSASASASLSAAASSALDHFLDSGVDVLAAAAAAGVRSYERYGLAAPPLAAGAAVPDEVEGEPSEQQQQQQEASKRRLSAKERSLLKKGQQPAAAAAAPAAPKQQQQQAQQQQQQPAAAAAAAAAAGGSARGKRGKAAKAKEKYADQDDEDRQLALALLGSQGEQKSRTQRRQERKEKKAARRSGAPAPGVDAAQLQEAIHKATGKQWQQQQEQQQEEEEEADAGSSSGSDAEQQQEEAPAAAEQQQEEEEDAGVDAAERAEVAALLAEENVQELPDAERERLTVLDSLTGCPRANDILLFAVPVCGPYSSMQAFKYKVKVIPGTVKKGKAARQALELLSRAPDVSAREKELLRAVPEQDMINAMVGAAKLSMPGLQKLKQSEKKAKKACRG